MAKEPFNKAYWSFSVGPLVDGRIVAPVCGERATREEAAQEAKGIAGRMLDANDTVEVRLKAPRS